MYIWLKRILWVCISLSLLVGIWGLYQRLFVGKESLALGSYITWGLWIAMYIFFAGMAAGMFFLSTLDLLFKVRVFAGIGKTCLLAAVVSLIAGLLHVWLDIGHPERIWAFFFSPNLMSVMTQIVLMYTAFAAVTVALLIITLLPEEHAFRGKNTAIKALSIAGIIIGIGTSGAVGAFLGVQSARPFWHVGLFAVQFPIFSLGSGMALSLILLLLLGDKKNPEYQRLLRFLALATVVLQVVKLYFVWADFAQSVYGGLPENKAAIELLLFGQYWYGFWIIQILIGSLVPIIILLLPKLKTQPVWGIAAGTMVLIGFAVARLNIIIPALAVPEIEALRDAFIDPRLSFTYFPSLSELAVTVGITGLAVLLFYIVFRLLPITKEAL